MAVPSRADPLPARRITVTLAALIALLAAGVLAGQARAAGNAASAAGFIESAQNRDGGFAETRGQPSSPAASLWATVALLAAGKNPADEHLNGGASAVDYLAGHLPAYRSLGDLGLLAIVQSASGVPASRFGDPGAQLRTDLTVPEIRGDPGGAALGVIGLLALHANGAAGAAAQTLPGVQQPDGGWGAPGDSTSASTALVLEALAQSGTSGSAQTSVRRGLAYLHKAQVNDGSIATSDRTDASSSGDVGATAFTIQALATMNHGTLRTATGTSVRDGLASYQQLSSGGLSPFGAYDTGVAPSVTQTAQAYPAFDGIALPLPYVAPAPPRPKPPHTTTPTPPPAAPNRASVGSTSGGISSSTPSTRRQVAAYQGATATGSVKVKTGHGGRGAGLPVTGSVVATSSAPKLTTRTGRPPGKDLSALYLALALGAVALGGAVLDWRRPRRSERPIATVALERISALTAAARRRGALAPGAIVLVGAALVAVPAISGMWSRAPRGAKMISAFAPYMQPAQLTRLRGDVRTIDAGVQQTVGRGPQSQFPRESDAHRRFVAADPGIITFAGQWHGIHGRLTGLLDPIAANRGNFRALAGLPSFRLFPWFLVIPGAVLVAIGLVAIVFPRSWRRLRWAVLAVGAVLALAPVAIGLYSAGPRGSRLVRAFGPIETRATVTSLQTDFSTLVVGQAMLRSALPAHVAASLPALTTLNDRWIGILGDFTPLLGVMSDQIPNYQAVAELPDFTIFPWLFTASGALVIALVLLAGGHLGMPQPGRRGAANRQLQARSSA